MQGNPLSLKHAFFYIRYSFEPDTVKLPPRPSLPRLIIHESSFSLLCIDDIKNTWSYDIYSPQPDSSAG